MTQPPPAPSPHDPASSSPPAGAPGASYAPPPQGGEGGQGRGKGPLLAAVGCGLLVLVLLLALIGFFGVRAWMGADERGEQASTSPEAQATEDEASAEESSEEEPAEEPTEEEATTEEPTTAEPTEEEVAAGEANAVPHGTTITLPELESYEGSLDIAIGEVDWDATEWVSSQNSHNPQPTDQGKYIMVTAEVTYHGPDEFSSYAFVPVDYVAEDGTPYEEAGVVTPDTQSKLALRDGESGTLHWVFMVPVDIPEGGHFVLADGLPQDEALVEGQWVEAA